MRKSVRECAAPLCVLLQQLPSPPHTGDVKGRGCCAPCRRPIKSVCVHKEGRGQVGGGGEKWRIFLCVFVGIIWCR